MLSAELIHHELAQQAGLSGLDLSPQTMKLCRLVEAAAAAAAYERAAVVCDEHHKLNVYNMDERLVAESCASAIRAMAKDPS